MLKAFCFKSKNKIFLFFLLFVIFFTFPAGDIRAEEVELPDYSGYVNDFAGILDPVTKADLESLITSVEKDSGAEIAVVTIASLEGLTIEDYAARLFEKWGIGKADKKDNGLLILVASQEREVRIEVGYGLEGIITDLEAGGIINDIIVPNFKNENYNRGLYDAVVTISNQIYGDEDYKSAMGTEYAGITGIETSTGSGDFPSFWTCCFPVFFFVFLITFLVNLFKRRCPRCLKFFKLKIVSKVLKYPTYTSTGEKLVERTCINCGFHDKKTVIIPKKTRSSGGTGFGGGWSGGRSSGGGFGGFGGGSSGGGGASGRW